MTENERELVRNKIIRFERQLGHARIDLSYGDVEQLIYWAASLQTEAEELSELLADMRGN